MTACLRLLFLLALVLLTACGTRYRDNTQPITAQADFDPARYLGTWYEIARYPVAFQRGCTATTATYGALDADTISVLNTCRQDSPDGPLRSVKGTADISGPGQLKVQFASVPFVRAPYWVLWVDETYDTAVVGVPNGRAGWILARRPRISDAKRAEAEAVLRANGYDPAALLNVQHPAD
ncbi:lipocalin family protein [Roseobacter weihaiensis]|uniref:lipocalin family protein n=1 Tax=Roseobacter weihaiensis TaxID=2763262 RepID=UPI001D0B5845|nr:lipocalin family protein [Roseobacter sp. H9]